MAKITIFPVNIGEYFKASVLEKLCKEDDNVHLLINDIDFFKKTKKYLGFGIGVIETEYVIRDGNFCSKRGCVPAKKGIEVINEQDFISAKEMLPPDFEFTKIPDLLATAPERILLANCLSLGIASIKGTFSERKFRNRLGWLRERDSMTDRLLEHSLINEKRIPLCRGILATLNDELQKQYSEICYVVSEEEIDIFENGIEATKNVFGVTSQITVVTY